MGRGVPTSVAGFFLNKGEHTHTVFALTSSLLRGAVLSVARFDRLPAAARAKTKKKKQAAVQVTGRSLFAVTLPYPLDDIRSARVMSTEKAPNYWYVVRHQARANVTSSQTSSTNSVFLRDKISLVPLAGLKSTQPAEWMALLLALLVRTSM